MIDSNDETTYFVKIFNLITFFSSVALLLILVPSRLPAIRDLLTDSADPRMFGHPIAEVGDRLVVAVALTIGVSGGFGFLVFGRSRIKTTLIGLKTDLFIAISCFITFAGSTLALNEYLGVSPKQLWTKSFTSGLGASGFWATIAGIAFLITLTCSLANSSMRPLLNQLEILASLVLGAIIVCCFFPAAIITSNSVPFSFDWSIVVGELLGPAIDRAPLANLTPQYSSLLGWVLHLVPNLPTNMMIETTVVYVSIMFLTINVTLYFVLRLVMPFANRIFLIFGCSGVMLYRPDSSLVGSLTAFPSFAVRHVLPVLSFYFLLSGLFKHSRWRVLVAGTISVGAFINNFEFGLVGVVAILLTCVVLWILSHELRLLLALVVVVIAAGITSFYLTAGEDVLTRHSLAARSFNNGFGNIAMPIFGLHLLTLSATSAAITLGITFLRNPIDRRQTTRATAAVLFGIYSTMGHLYFAGRSVISTQLTTLLPFVGIALVAAITIRGSQLFKALQVPWSKRRFIELLPILWMIALPSAVVTGLPNPNVEWARLKGDIKGSFEGNARMDTKYFLESPMVRQLTDMMSIYGRNGQVAVLAEKNGLFHETLTSAEGLMPAPAFTQVAEFGMTEELCNRVIDFEGKVIVIEGRQLKNVIRGCLISRGRDWEMSQTTESEIAVIYLLS